MEDFQKCLGEYIHQGVAPDVYEADRAWTTMVAIGERADSINEKSLGRLFSYLQSLLVDQYVLAVSRMYDRYSDRYPTRSIPSVIVLLRKNFDQLAICQREIAIQKLSYFGVNVGEAQNMDDATLSGRIVDTLEYTVPRLGLENPSRYSTSLGRVKALRDKKIAHNEAIAEDELTQPTATDIRLLLDYGKNFVSLVGAAFTNTIYESASGSYMLTSNAEVYARQTKVLLDMAGLE